MLLDNIEDNIGIFLIKTSGFLSISSSFNSFSNLRAANLEKDIERLELERDQFQSRVKVQEVKLEAYAATDTRALKLLELISERKREEAIQEFEKLDRKSLQEVALLLLNEEVDAFRKELALETFRAGVAQWKIGGFKRAIQEFKQSRSYSEKTDFQALLHFYLGHSHYKEKEYKQAVPELLRSLEIDGSHDMATTAEYSIGLVYVEQGEWQKALDFYQDLMQRRNMGGYRTMIWNLITRCQRELASAKAKENNPTP